MNRQKSNIEYIKFSKAPIKKTDFICIYFNVYSEPNQDKSSKWISKIHKSWLKDKEVFTHGY